MRWCDRVSQSIQIALETSFYYRERSVSGKDNWIWVFSLKENFDLDIDRFRIF